MVFFFGLFLRRPSGRNSRLDREKLKFYSLLLGLYYHINVDCASLLWEEFTSYVNHIKKENETESARFWSLILIEAYQQNGIQVQKGEKVVVFSHLQIPKSLVDDPDTFPIIDKMLKRMIDLAPLLNPILIRYREILGEVEKVPTS